MEKKYERNIRLYYCYTLVYQLMFIAPILTLFYLELGLNFTQIMLLTSVSSGVVFALEVPSGVLADIVGRKFSLILASIFFSLAILLLFFATTFWTLILSEIIFAFGIASESGAGSALLYDTLKKLKRTEEYKKICGLAHSFGFYANSITVVIGSFLYKYNMRLPFILTALVLAFGIAFACFMTETRQYKEKGFHITKYYKQTYLSFLYTVKHKKLLAIALSVSLCFVFYKPVMQFYQPYMKDVRIPVEYFGFIFFLFNLTAGFFSQHSEQVMRRIKSKTLISMSILMCISFFILSSVYNYWGILAIFLHQIVRGMRRTVEEHYVNKYAPSKVRASVLSTVSFISSIAVMSTAPFLGMIKDHHTIYETFRIFAWILFGMIILNELYLKNVFRKVT